MPKRARRNKPSAMVVDVLLKDDNSWAFISEVKNAPETRDIPVMMVSVLEEYDKGIALGADDYMTKPVDRRWLLERLHAIAEKKPVEKVLIIDDEEVARYILKGMLADTKYRFVEACGGIEGLDKARRELPDLILLDLMMPDMSGFEVIHELKRDPAPHIYRS